MTDAFMSMEPIVAAEPEPDAVGYGGGLGLDAVQARVVCFLFCYVLGVIVQPPGVPSPGGDDFLQAVTLVWLLREHSNEGI